MKRAALLGLALAGFLTSCTSQGDPNTQAEQEDMKINVYQVFTRLFGNTNTSNKAWGTLEENGVGKFNDFSWLKWLVWGGSHFLRLNHAVLRGHHQKIGG